MGFRIFYPSIYGDVEIDYTKTTGEIPERNGYQHPDPQHWFDLKKLALERDGWACTDCGEGWNLILHHRTYKNWGHEKLEDVYIKCQPCHVNFHSGRKVSARPQIRRAA